MTEKTEQTQPQYAAPYFEPRPKSIAGTALRVLDIGERDWPNTRHRNFLSILPRNKIRTPQEFFGHDYSVDRFAFFFELGRREFDRRAW